MDELADMDERELVQRARRNRVEQACHDAGCLIGLAFGVFFCWFALLVLPLGASHAASFFRITAAVAAFLLAPMAGKIVLQRIANFRGQAFRTELERRYGQLPWKQQLHLTRTGLQPSEVAILLRDRAETPPTVTTRWEIRFRPSSGELRKVHGDEFDFGRGLDPVSNFQVDSRALTADEVAALNDAWKTATAHKPKNVAPPDELLSEKTQVAVIPATGHIRSWAAHNSATVVRKSGDVAWQEFLAAAFRLMELNKD